MGTLMTYRNGTYIAFHANSTTDPTASDIRYYNLIKAWSERSDDDFSFINSHEKTAAVRDSSLRETLRSRLVTRLRNSKQLLLIVGKTTKEDTDWVPFEIRYAIDECNIPVIAAYTITDKPILRPSTSSTIATHWPAGLRTRIENNTAGVIHIPFRKEPIKAAVGQFNQNNFPNGGGLGWYNEDAYRSWGML
jgi:hypothetical protein